MIVFAVGYVDVLDLTHARFTCMLCKICKYGSFCGIFMYFVVGYPNIQVSTQCTMYIDICIIYLYIFVFFNKDGGIINTHSLDKFYVAISSHTNAQRCMSAWNRDAGW